ncbi:uncharacterized protein LOC131684460 [Topomyia yanbarensis]|uniref:uncharacterized protein LOC131684460 n=1 Tax=Topomyia yanbarensis TaxID=2498891 RepID=UPI00273B661A|nr:uncharacterized protein LOC131684460 [Topomyia yanbarensis]XP_058823348.1 uncharacterized protein LOC131684460 [Topomyia yanbarensis]XP_058823349.1 uncharacterized protein LOC131684460 [Topomyia yanbarensis]XP_058823350.1 uncharacterized protein LOC131684460 [Topomyia yanbarensis]XP_058823351.1 uncharacterized protein LOC131684460 [Topomyia yanbarensis]
MLAVDCLVGGLLLSSIGVNILALGAFWVTPSLRTTANRFVINLLVVNLVCCIILGPSLLLNAFTSKSAPVSPSTVVVLAATTASTSTTTTAAAASTSGNGSSVVASAGLPYAIAVNATISEDDNVHNRTYRVVKCRNATTIGCDTILIRSNVNVEDVRYVKSHHGDVIDSKLTLTKIRCWGLDLVVALGALSVLLVVGDTWCAVTDPLRYHSRISDLKAWAFIAGTWLLGIAFGIASGFRGDQKNITLFNSRLTSAEATTAFDASHLNNKNLTAASQRDNGLINHLNISEDLYNTIFSYTYFVIVILLPFALVCGMYWRIYSEARESGQRMRQNGSSPLLQSALNLAAVSAQKQAEKQAEHHRQQPDRDGGCDGLTMKIDKQIHYEDETITVNSIEHSSSIKQKYSCLKPLLQQSPESTPTHQPIQHGVEESSIVQMVNSTTVASLSIPANRLQTSLKQERNHSIMLSSSEAGRLTCKDASNKIRRNHSAGRLVSFNEQNQELLPALRQVQSTPNFQKLVPSEFDHIGNHHILSLPAVHVPPKALSYMTSIRHRLSNASSLFKYREESRAARISILVIIMFLVSYLPYGILVLMQGHVDLFLVSDQALLAILTVVIANLSSPFIFAYRNKRVRRGVKRLLGIDRKTNERLLRLTSSNTHFNNNNNINSNNNYSANISFHNATNGADGSASNGHISTHHKSHKVRIAGLSRSNSTCKYLTPNHAAAVAVANGFIVEFERYPSDELNSLCIQKKSILKRVCDSSRKWGCNFATNSCTSNDEQTEV